MNIYISSSWKNRERVRALAIALRGQGHEVYDFTDPACRKALEIPPEAFPEQFDPNKHVYSDYLQTVPHWRQAVYGNLEALRRCDLCLLLLPCGADSHADWGVAVGLGKRTVVVGHPKAGERTPSHLWSEKLLIDEAAALSYIGTKLANEREWLQKQHVARLIAELQALHDQMPCGEGKPDIAKQNAALRECVTYARSKRGKDFDFDTWEAMCEAAMAGEHAPSALENEIALHAQTRDALIAVRKERDALLVDTCHGASCGKCLLCRVRWVLQGSCESSAKLKRP